MERVFLKHLLVMPPGIARLTSIQNFRYATLFHLLAAGDLTLISVWSPTFLTSLLSQLDAWSDRLSDDLRLGRMRLPLAGDTQMSDDVLANPGAKRRADQVGSILRSNDSLPAKLSQIWPQLDLISCWADSAAATYVASVREYFPGVTIQPKGLISTEACVSFPLVGRAGAALALRSHFFEFLPASASRDDDATQLADQLDVGQQYEVVVSTGGGLYRYLMRDVVEVVGHVNRCPLLRFIGRNDRVSDLVGEKLNESHVSRVLQQVFRTHEVKPSFAMIVPVANPASYRLYLEVHDHQLSLAAKAAILRDVEAGLRENPHYQYAQELDQLQPLELQIAADSQRGLWQQYEHVMLARGQKAGEIKPTALDSWTGWHEEFESEKTTSPPQVTPVVE